MAVDFDRYSLSELVQMQSEIAQHLTRRFQRHLALGFTDVVGSTAYFTRFGDVAGRVLQQRHLDLLTSVVGAADGRIVDTAGDGAFTCFPSADAAIHAMMELQRLIEAQNLDHAAEHRLVLRCGIHFGPVLTDSVIVSGDAVNLCSRISTSAEPAEVRLSREAFTQLSSSLRVRCQPLAPAHLKGIADPVAVFQFEWRERDALPGRVRMAETGKEHVLPDQDVVMFGRLDEVYKDGTSANDIVLALDDEMLTAKISRWHFELRRRSDGYFLRSVSDGLTIVDGESLAKGQEARIRSGSIVKVADVITLTFLPVSEPVGLTERMKATVLG